jgi:hypothetical protein
MERIAYHGNSYLGKHVSNGWCVSRVLCRYPCPRVTRLGPGVGLKLGPYPLVYVLTESGGVTTMPV